jgi:hypothetical protein
MRSRTIATAVVLAAFTALAGACSGPPAASATRAEPEVSRLRRHFATVLDELAAADVSHLTPPQRAARARAVARLRRYRDRGVFPHNHDRAARTPFFVDEHGTRCAMAYLIEEAGGGTLVASIAAARNNAYIPELTGDAALVAWLDANGLTAAEAARIQPAYDGCGFEDCSDDLDRKDLVTALGLAVIDGAAIAVNLRDDAGTNAGVLGLVAGGITAGFGYGKIHGAPEEATRERDLGWTVLGVGVVTAAVSLHTLVRGRPAAPAAPPAAAGPPGGWSVAPLLGETRGVSLATRF